MSVPLEGGIMTGFFPCGFGEGGGGFGAGRAPPPRQSGDSVLCCFSQQSVGRVIKRLPRGWRQLLEQQRSPRRKRERKAVWTENRSRLEMKMLVVLLASWLVLARSATVAPKDDGAEVPVSPPTEEFLQKEINPMENLPFQFVLQEEVDPFMDPVDQREVLELPLLIHGEPQGGFSAFAPRGLKPSGRGRPRYPSNLPEFPPGRPTLGNLNSICAEERQGAAYGPWNLPSTGFSHLSRQGEALNDLESSMGQCCQLAEDKKLDCSLATWSHVLEKFCDAEFSVKTRPYPCCKLEGASKDNCFANLAPFPNYDYVGAQGQREKLGDCTHSDPSWCKPKDLVPARKLPALSFPPGRPTNANIKNICKLRKFRPVYLPSTLPKTGFGWFVRQARALNRLENEFKKCCRKENVGCAQRGWGKVLTQFCKQEGSVKTRPHFCCKEAEAEDRLTCFADQAPFPAYDKEIRVVNLAEITPSLLDQLCGQVTLLSKQKHVPALVQNITEPCCTLEGDERTQCAQEEKREFIATLCNSPKAFWKDTKKCCAQAEDAARVACFDSSYLRNVTLASAAQPLQPTVPAE
ncbi:extracellular matrix protein 1 [Heteronotia binoei]|uniref:extracellular matrix protein 1 n=1 Tax=Heteronotia binoei TaxID=13085 RepID=UPI00292D2D87|nr:extracellular matrix protein 1 [Heteronotia binoei]